MTVRSMRPFPARGPNPDVYITKVGESLGDLPGVIDDINTTVVEMGQMQTAAQAFANAASTSAGTAQSASNAALAAVGAALWVANTNYSAYATVISRIDGLAYRTLTAGVSATDPKLDGARWFIVSNVAAPTVLILAEQQAAGVGGGNGTASTATYTRNFNTTRWNTMASVSVAGGVITLPAGTYDVDACALQSGASSGSLSIVNMTDGQSLVQGINTPCNSATQAIVQVFGRFFLPTTKQVAVRHLIVAYGSNWANMLGVPMSQGIEVYSQIQLWKVA